MRVLPPPITRPADTGLFRTGELQSAAQAVADRSSWALVAEGEIGPDTARRELFLRGYSYKIRKEDQQANVGETVGTTAASGGKYPFPTLSASTNLKGDDLIMPTTLVSE